MVRTYQRSRSKAPYRTQLTPGRTVADLVEYDRMHYKHISPHSPQHPSRSIGSPATTPNRNIHEKALGLYSPLKTPRSIVKRMRKEPLSIQQFLAPFADHSTVLSDDDIVEVDDPIRLDTPMPHEPKRRSRLRKLPVHRLRFTRQRSPELERVPIVDTIQSFSSKDSQKMSESLDSMEGHQRHESLDLGMMDPMSAHPLEREISRTQHLEEIFQSYPGPDHQNSQEINDDDLLSLFESPPSPILRAIENSERSDEHEIPTQGRLTFDAQSVLGFDDIGKPIKRTLKRMSKSTFNFDQLFDDLLF